MASSTSFPMCASLFRALSLSACVMFLAGADRASASTSPAYTITHQFSALTGSEAVGSVVCDNKPYPSKQTCYGSTSTGGEYNIGTIFKVRGDGTQYRVITTFDIFNGGFPSVQPVLSGDMLYGINAQTGYAGSGSIWSKNLTSGTVSTLFSFTGATGTTSQAPLVISRDGKTLFGITGQAGPNAQGTVWRFDLETAAFTLLHSFTGGATDGSTPFSPPTLSPDGTMLVGATFLGGAADGGVIYQCSTAPGGEYRILASFNHDATGPGSKPQMGGLAYSKDGTTLYGMAWFGGATSNGTVFALDLKNTSNFRALHSFTGADGAMPYGGPTLSPDGKTLYGLTWRGGSYGRGVVYALGTDGAYRVLHSLGGGRLDGGHPFGGVTVVNGGRTLLGIAGANGANGNGVIFRLKL